MKLQYIRFPLLILVLVIFLLPIAAAAKKEKETVWNQTNFWFRDDDGAENSATGYGLPEDNIGEHTSITGVAPGNVFRLRFGIRATDADGALVPHLEFKQGADCAIGSWTTVTSTSDVFNLRLSDNFSDGASTTRQITNGQFVAGKILESTNPASFLNLDRNKNTEYEWSMEVDENTPFDTMYSFRVSNNGAAFDNYGVCPTLTTQSPPASTPSPPPSGEGGGWVAPRGIVFYGQAYPNSKVEAMFKGSVDGLYYNLPQAECAVSDDGKFSVNYIGLMRGDYFFGLRVEDKDNRKTGIWPFRVEFFNDQIIAKDLLVPPTIGFLRGTIRKGDFLTILGYAASLSVIEIEVDGKPIREGAEAGTDGFYKASINTAELAFGEHAVQTRQKAENGKTSDFSLKKTFTVSKLLFPRTDFNNDDKIDISDWSVFLSRWGSKDEELKKQLDFNEDGKVDISDFSAFLRTIKK